MKPLLQPKREGEHLLYARIRDQTDPHSEERRQLFSEMWAEYAPFAPKGFAKKLQVEFHQRWWEMYLAVALLRCGFTPKKDSADAGPDVILDVDGRQVFIEAVTPLSGRSSDSVPDPVHNGVSDFPERECLLRLTQALTEKKKRFREYVDAGTVPSDACKIIALSASDLKQFGTLLDGVHPAPLSVLAGAGPTVVAIGGMNPPYSSARNSLTRDSGSPVNAALFETPDFSIISGVLYSPVDLWNVGLGPEDSLALFVNPAGHVPVPMSFQSRFVTWRQESQEGSEIVWKRSQPSPIEASPQTDDA
jgi:hypothetical protein